MITDQETNFVYFSEQLIEKGFETEYNKIVSILEKYKIGHGLLKGTKDIWCRDYMPIQVDKDKFVQFEYEPWYLNDTEEHKKSKSNPKEVCDNINIQPIFSNINLDGGNVVKSHKKTILNERLFEENPKFIKTQIVEKLNKLFDSEIIIIPQINKANDTFGHADGMVRIYNSNTILVNELENEFEYWSKGILKTIKDNNFKYIEIPWFEENRKGFKKEYPDSAIGLYINFLEVGNLIIIPKFRIEGNRDDETYMIFKKHYPDKIIEQVEINEIAKFGGLLNCMTWNIRK